MLTFFLQCRGLPVHLQDDLFEFVLVELFAIEPTLVRPLSWLIHVDFQSIPKVGLESLDRVWSHVNPVAIPFIH